MPRPLLSERSASARCAGPLCPVRNQHPPAACAACRGSVALPLRDAPPETLPGLVPRRSVPGRSVRLEAGDTAQPCDKPTQAGGADSRLRELAPPLGGQPPVRLVLLPLAQSGLRVRQQPRRHAAVAPQ